MIWVATSETGIIQGGWEFIWAAYGATWIFLTGYALSLIIRGRTPPEQP